MVIRMKSIDSWFSQIHTEQKVLEVGHEIPIAGHLGRCKKKFRMVLLAICTSWYTGIYLELSGLPEDRAMAEERAPTHPRRTILENSDGQCRSLSQDLAWAWVPVYTSSLWLSQKIPWGHTFKDIHSHKHGWATGGHLRLLWYPKGDLNR